MTSPQGPTPASDAPRNDSNGPKLPPNLPDPEIEPRSRWLPSLVWVIPLIAALIGIALVIKSVTEKGPTITITLHQRRRPRARQDQGQVQGRRRRLGEEHHAVEGSLARAGQVQLTKEAEDFAVKDTRFWVVRPRVGASGVTGLEHAAVGRVYRRGRRAFAGGPRTHFVGLETPPADHRRPEGPPVHAARRVARLDRYRLADLSTGACRSARWSASRSTRTAPA